MVSNRCFPAKMVGDSDKRCRLQYLSEKINQDNGKPRSIEK